MQDNEREYFCGAFWAASVVFRQHADTIITKDLLTELPDAHEIARYSPEYDVQPLRLHVLESLPLGIDAEYTSIGYGPVSNLGDLICDQTQARELSDDKISSWGVYGVQPNGERLLLTSGLPEAEEAEGQAELLAAQLTQIKATRDQTEAF